MHTRDRARHARLRTCSLTRHSLPIQFVKRTGAESPPRHARYRLILVSNHRKQSMFRPYIAKLGEKKRQPSLAWNGMRGEERNCKVRTSPAVKMPRRNSRVRFEKHEFETMGS